MQVSQYFCPTSFLLGYIASDLKNLHPWRLPSFPGPLFLPRFYALVLYQTEPWRGQGWWASCVSFSFKLHHCPGCAWASHSPPVPSCQQEHGPAQHICHWFLCRLEKEVMINVPQECPGLPVPSFVVPPANIGVLKLPIKTRAWECAGVFVASGEIPKFYHFTKWEKTSYSSITQEGVSHLN